MNPNNWIILGSGKVGEEMSEDDRIQLLTLLRNQHTSRLKHGWVECPCGKIIKSQFQYRCYFCDVTFCPKCAKIHFGERTH